MTGATRTAPTQLTVVASLTKALFGYDIFISYSRGQARAYAAELSRVLAKHDLSCFLDQTDAPPGAELIPSLVRELNRASRLIVIGTPGVFAAGGYVDLEVRAFLQGSGHAHRLLAIDVERRWSTLCLWDEVRNTVRIEVTMDEVAAGNVSEDLIGEIVKHYRVGRRNRLSRLLVAAVIAILTLLVLWANAERSEAEAQRAVAATERDAAQAQREVAESNRAHALAVVGRVLKGVADTLEPMAGGRTAGMTLLDGVCQDLPSLERPQGGKAKPDVALVALRADCKRLEGDLVSRRDPDLAEKNYKVSQLLRQSLLKAGAPETALLAGEAETLDARANLVDWVTEKPADVAQLRRQAADLRQRLVATDPTDIVYRTKYSMSLVRLGRLTRENDPRRAREYYDNALEQIQCSDTCTEEMSPGSAVALRGAEAALQCARIHVEYAFLDLWTMRDVNTQKRSLPAGLSWEEIRASAIRQLGKVKQEAECAAKKADSSNNFRYEGLSSEADLHLGDIVIEDIKHAVDTRKPVLEQDFQRAEAHFARAHDAFARLAKVAAGDLELKTLEIQSAIRRWHASSSYVNADQIAAKRNLLEAVRAVVAHAARFPGSGPTHVCWEGLKALGIDGQSPPQDLLCPLRVEDRR